MNSLDPRCSQTVDCYIGIELFLNFFQVLKKEQADRSVLLAL